MKVNLSSLRSLDIIIIIIIMQSVKSYVILQLPRSSILSSQPVTFSFYISCRTTLILWFFGILLGLLPFSYQSITVLAVLVSFIRMVCLWFFRKLVIKGIFVIFLIFTFFFYARNLTYYRTLNCVLFSKVVSFCFIFIVEGNMLLHVNLTITIYRCILVPLKITSI